MIRFIYREEKRIGEAAPHVEVSFTVERQDENGRWLKTLQRPFLFREDEWDAFKAMLIHGSTWFQEGEATIVIEQHDKVHAYMEGENGRQES